MFAEGESELRDLVVQNLESCGFLNKIKAELRAGVFLALSDEGSLKKKVPLFNKKLDNFIHTNDGKLALSIVREFLEYFNLNFTLSVFDPEVSISTPYASRKDLCEDLDLNETECDGPILLTLFKAQGTTKSGDLDLNPKKNEKGEKKSDDSGEKCSDNDKRTVKSNLNSFQRSTKQTKNFFDEKSETAYYENNKNNISVDTSSFSMNKVGNNMNFFNFSKPEEKDIIKDQSIDHFFDEPVPSEKPNILHLTSAIALNEKSLSSTCLTSEIGSTSALTDEIKNPLLTSAKESTSALNDQIKISSTFLSSEKGSLSSLRDLPALMKQDNSKNKEPLAILGSDILASGNMDIFNEDLTKKDVDPESTEEFSDKHINSEESIEEEIEEEFSAGLDDLLNSSLSLGDDATSDQTVSQTSVVDGVDHIETCNTLN